MLQFFAVQFIGYDLVEICSPYEVSFLGSLRIFFAQCIVQSSPILFGIINNLECSIFCRFYGSNFESLKVSKMLLLG